MIRIGTLTIQFEIQEENMNNKPEPVAAAVALPPDQPNQRGEQENTEENQATRDQEQQTEKRDEKKESDNAMYYVIEQILKQEAQDEKDKEEEMKKKMLKEEPVEEQPIKIEPQEPPVEEPKPVEAEPKDLCKKRVRKGRGISRRRHVYQRRSTVIEPTTSKAAAKMKDTPIDLDDDEDEEDEKPISQIGGRPGKTTKGGKKIKNIKLEPADDIFE